MAQAMMTAPALRLATLQSNALLGADSSALQAACSKQSVAVQPVGLKVVAKKGRRTAARKAVAAVAAAAVAAPVLVAEPQTAQAAGLHIEDVQAAFAQAQNVSEKVIAGAKVAFGTAVDVVEQVVKVVKPAVDAAAPVVQDAAGQALKVATPYADSLTKEAQKALQSAGVDTNQVGGVVKVVEDVAGTAAVKATTAAQAASPIAQSTLESVLESDPLILAGGAGALILLYLSAPAIAGSFAKGIRGYRGDLTAAQALDLLGSDDYTLIDIRTEKEKARSGIPSVPRNAQRKVLAVPNDEFDDRKLRGQLRNAKSVEAQVCAIKVSCLKKLGKSSKVILIDAYGDVSKQVAKALTTMGFSNIYVLKDGFEGRTGWVNSKLSTESFDLRSAEVLSPSRILSAGTGGFGTGRKVVDAEVVRGPKRLSLPGN